MMRFEMYFFLFPAFGVENVCVFGPALYFVTAPHAGFSF